MSIVGYSASSDLSLCRKLPLRSKLKKRLPFAGKRRLTSAFKHIGTWSFDKGYWHPDNRTLLEMVVPDVIMPKKGKCNQTELDREHQNVFKKYGNRHSAVESNIHSLETGGLSRCPDRGEKHFNRYVALGVCAYSLCCIGRKLKADYWQKELRLKKVA
jgi:hypothetical protein